jgi:hypothetical protein
VCGLTPPKAGSRSEIIGPGVSPAIKSVGGSRGGAEPRVTAHDAKSVTVRLPLETETEYESYEIRVNDKSIRANLKAVTDSGGKHLNVSLPARNITLSVWGIDRERGEEKTIAVYQLEVKSRR